MAQPDRKNAHIRQNVKQEDKAQTASDANRLLNDPAFKRAFDATQEALVKQLVDMKHDGQPETDAFEREVCRSLRTLGSVKRALVISTQGQKLRAADFKPNQPDE